MKFLKNYKKGGDRTEKVASMKKPVYISKRNHQDFIAEVSKAFVKESVNPRKLGQESFIMELKPVKINNADHEMSQANEDGARTSGSQLLEEGKVCTYYINLSTKQEDFALDFAMEEYAEAVAAGSGETKEALLEDLISTPDGKPAKIQKLMVDDFKVGQGKKVRVFTNEEPSDSGWYKLHIEAAE